MKLYQKYYTLGVYIDTWGWGEGVIPHVFLGLKKEYQLIDENFQGTLSDELKKNYILESELEKHSKTTQMQLIENLTQEYKNNDINKEKWKKQTTDFDDNYLFFRQGYRDITIQAKEYFKNAIFFHYQAYKRSLINFIQSEKSNIQNIEGFFGFAPYKSAPLRTSSYGDKESGGKVFQNNHYDYEKRENNNINEEKHEHSGESLRNDTLSKYSFSKGHVLVGIRPLSTFQNKQAFAIKIPNEKYIEVASKILEDVLITDDSLRGGFAFVKDDNQFRFYALVGNSCVDFVMDKLKIVFAGRLDWWDKRTSTPQGVYDVIKKHSKAFNEQELSMLEFLLDLQLFYQNYSTLCNIDSTWACEEGLKAFSQYCEFLLHSNLLNHTRLNRLTDNITNNQLKSLARNAEIEQIEDDVNMRLNTHFCIASYFQDRLKYKSNLQTEVALIIYDDEKECYLKADSQSKFAFSEFSYDRNIPSHNIALWYEQPILFAENPYPLAIQIQENIFNDYPKYFAQCIVGNKKDYGDYRNFLKQEEVSNA